MSKISSFSTVTKCVRRPGWKGAMTNHHHWMGGWVRVHWIWSGGRDKVTHVNDRGRPRSLCSRGEPARLSGSLARVKLSPVDEWKG